MKREKSTSPLPWPLDWPTYQILSMAICLRCITNIQALKTLGTLNTNPKVHLIVNPPWPLEFWDQRQKRQTICKKEIQISTNQTQKKPSQNLEIEPVPAEFRWSSKPRRTFSSWLVQLHNSPVEWGGPNGTVASAWDFLFLVSIGTDLPTLSRISLIH